MLAGVGILLGLVGCSPLGALDALTPAGDYAATLDIAYGPQPRQRLDVYVPAGPAVTRSVIVFFYGGNWQSGDKAGYRFVAESLTRHGHIVVIPDYRVYPAAVFPGFVEDSARAVAWVDWQHRALWRQCRCHPPDGPFGRGLQRGHAGAEHALSSRRRACRAKGSPG